MASSSREVNIKLVKHWQRLEDIEELRSKPGKSGAMWETSGEIEANSGKHQRRLTGTG
jgi:hypothetical protein